jgi:hypothetical protein
MACSLVGGAAATAIKSRRAPPRGTKSRRPITRGDGHRTGVLPHDARPPEAIDRDGTDPKGPARVTLYTLERGEEGYAISVAKEPQGVDQDLDGAIQGAAANVNSTVAERKESTY